MEVSLVQLGKEYEERVGCMTDLIHKYTAKMHAAERHGDYNVVYRLKAQIADLYAQRDYMREVATHLIHYYDIH